MTKLVVAQDIHGVEHELEVSSLRWRPSAYAVVIREGSLLLVPAFGKYTIPGGGLELGESIEEALIREVREETGVTVAEPKLLGVESSFFCCPARARGATRSSPYCCFMLVSS